MSLKSRELGLYGEKFVVAKKLAREREKLRGVAMRDKGER